ncbi:hypothetical protein F4604DRAFT_1748417 [Suillus subluteus]|nr:hypothetical protein F4604DRAFT_1748417 [Suillus subluteus]
MFRMPIYLAGLLDTCNTRHPERSGKNGTDFAGVDWVNSWRCCSNFKCRCQVTHIHRPPDMANCLHPHGLKL